ncbi:hypothetical protein [Planococcus sp. ISL-110]|nr:hypothetical protein [Planococcus sp. ISL-110]
MHNYAKKPRKAYKRLSQDEKLEVVLEVLENGKSRPCEQEDSVY